MMSTELDNHNELETEQQSTPEINEDSVNVAESETDLPSNQDEDKSEFQGGESSSNDNDVDESSTVVNPDLTDSQPDSTATEDLDSEPVIEAEVNALALKAEIEGLKTQLENQKIQTQDIQGQFMRLTADFENYRRRTAKEKEDLEGQVKRKTLLELLSVVDNFERARTQIKPNDDGEMAIHKSYQGVYKTLVNALKSLGVSAMRPEGNPFDPNYHEAMMREPTNEYGEGVVIEQLVRGYMLNDQVLRHAMVKVATTPEDNQSTDNLEESNAETESQNIN